jgi:Cu/Ag efflux protein CusF
MKKVILSILSLMLLLCFSELASVAGCKGGDFGTATGQVTSIDLAALTITVKEKINSIEMDKTYKFDNETNFVEGNTLKSVKDLNPGDRVSIIYKKGGSNDIYAKTITIKK